MGHRSAIYIRIWDNYNTTPKLYAKYFNWNFGERMISRGRHGIEYIKANMKYISDSSKQEKINRIFDVNFDIKDIAITSDIIKEFLEQFTNYFEANEYIFECVANNNGKLFIDITKNGEIKYCFTDYSLKILTPTQYMNWDRFGWKNSNLLSEDEIEICKNNIKYINNNAKLMTKEELQEFINFDYSKQINDMARDLGIAFRLAPQEQVQKENQEKYHNEYDLDICE